MNRYVFLGIVVFMLLAITLAACSGGSGQRTSTPASETADVEATSQKIKSSTPLAEVETGAAGESPLGTAYPEPGQVTSVQPSPVGAYPPPQTGQAAQLQQPYPAPTTAQDYANPTSTAMATSAISVKTELEATDPASVNLASGEVQLVEFFAFW